MRYMNYNDIISFWFSEIPVHEWWHKDEKLDHIIFDRFEHIHHMATKGELFHWRDSVEGKLAEIIVIDQFSRHMYCHKPEAYAYDTLALILAQAMVASGEDRKLDDKKRLFCYMPYMHSESKTIQKVSIELFKSLNIDGAFEHAIKNKEIIDKFGRYPHRNELLKRKSTDEEILFLKEPKKCF